MEGTERERGRPIQFSRVVGEVKYNIWRIGKKMTDNQTAKRLIACDPALKAKFKRYPFLSTYID